MLRDASWIVAAFLIITIALGGVCARHIDRRKAKSEHYMLKFFNRNKPPVEYDEPRPVRPDYNNPSKYVVDTWD